MKKRTFGIFGNCQSGALAEVLLENDRFATDWHWVPLKHVHQCTMDDVSGVLAAVKELDLLIYQPFRGNGMKELASTELLKVLSTSADHICIPSMYFSGYFPQLAGIQGVMSPLNLVHDYLIIHFYLKGMSADKTIKVLRRKNLFKTKVAKSFFQRSIDELARRERYNNIDVVISDFVDTYARKYRLFNQINHPTKGLFQHVSNQIFQHLKIDGEFEIDLNHAGPLSAVICPPVRCLYHYNRCEFESDFDTYTVLGEKKSTQEVVEKMFQYFSKTETGILERHLKEKRSHVIAELSWMYR